VTRPTAIALAGLALAIAITSTMDAKGLDAFSALPLFPLALAFILFQRTSRREIGLVGAAPGHFGLAVVQPLAVMGLLAGIAALAGQVDLAHQDLGRACLKMLVVGAGTFLATLLTEEGFFRGWLWAALDRAGWSTWALVVGTGLGFAAWHISAATLAAGFRPPPSQVPVFLLNVLALGLAWGLLRARSGSIVVTSLVHGVWNGLAYVLFGFGTKVGALGVRRTDLFGPEVGFFGLALNLASVAWLWTTRPRSAARADAAMAAAPPWADGKAS
jgi:membrane protease YdiL (CAAX protease family)